MRRCLTKLEQIYREGNLPSPQCTKVFAKNAASRIVTAGLGGSPNDLPLLKSVEISILIPRGDGRCEAVDLSNRIQAEHSGSRGAE